MFCACELLFVVCFDNFGLHIELVTCRQLAITIEAVGIIH